MDALEGGLFLMSEVLMYTLQTTYTQHPTHLGLGAVEGDDNVGVENSVLYTLQCRVSVLYTLQCTLLHTLQCKVLDTLQCLHAIDLGFGAVEGDDNVGVVRHAREELERHRHLQNNYLAEM